MKLQDVLKEAKDAGYTQVDDGATTWDIDHLIAAIGDDAGDYQLDYTGNIRRFKDDGFLESSTIYTCEK